MNESSTKNATLDEDDADDSSTDNPNLDVDDVSEYLIPLMVIKMEFVIWIT